MGLFPTRRLDVHSLQTMNVCLDRTRTEVRGQKNIPRQRSQGRIKAVGMRYFSKLPLHTYGTVPQFSTSGAVAGQCAHFTTTYRRKETENGRRSEISGRRSGDHGVWRQTTSFAPAFSPSRAVVFALPQAFLSSRVPCALPHFPCLSV